MARNRWSDLLRHLRAHGPEPGDRDPDDGQLLRRFLDQRDEAAFALLVRRHGPMVLGVCRRILGDGHDAEDAFQATFLVLTKKAAALAERAVVGNWLYGVACRTALKARSLAARRRVKEREMARPEALSEDRHAEVKEVVDLELLRLPSKYRIPIVLCELEGKSLREAAEQLDWPEGTVAGRLSRGRQLLRERLVRRGITLTAGGLAAATVPPTLAAATVRAAVLLAAGEALAASASASVATLTEAVLQTMVIAKVRILVLAALAVGLVLGGVGVLRRAWTEQPPDVPALPGDQPPPTPVVAVRPVPVDAFGDPLPAGAVARLGGGRLRHGGRLLNLAFAPDGKTLASAGGHWANQVWDATTGRHRGVLTAERITTLATAFSRDGRRMGACVDGKTCVILEVADRREVLRLDNLAMPPRTLALSPDGQLLAIAEAKRVTLRGDDGKVVRELEASGEPRGLAFSADGGLLAVPQLDGVTLVYETATGDLRLRVAAERNAIAAEFSLDAAQLCIATSRAIHVVDLATTKAVRRFASGAGATVLRMAPDGQLLATARPDGRVQLWDWREGKEVRDLGPIEGTRALAFSPDGATLGVGGGWQVVKLFDVGTGQERLALGEHQSSLFCLGLTADGRTLVTGGESAFRVWDLETGRDRRVAPAGLVPTALAVSPGGRRLAGPVGDLVGVWETATGKECCRGDGGPGSAFALAFTPDGRQLAGASREVLRLWDATTGAKQFELARPKSQPRALAFAAAAPLLVAGYHDGSVAVWDRERGTLRREFTASRGNVLHLAVSPNGRQVVVTSVAPEVTLWDAERGELLWRHPRRRSQGRSPVALSPDGRWVACTEDERVIQLLDATTGQLVRALEGHVAEVTGLAFSPDGERLYSSSLDTSVLVWKVTDGAAVAPTE